MEVHTASETLTWTQVQVGGSKALQMAYEKALHTLVVETDTRTLDPEKVEVDVMVTLLVRTT